MITKPERLVRNVIMAWVDRSRDHARAQPGPATWSWAGC